MVVLEPRFEGLDSKAWKILSVSEDSVFAVLLYPTITVYSILFQSKVVFLVKATSPLNNIHQPTCSYCKHECAFGCFLVHLCVQ